MAILKHPCKALLDFDEYAMKLPQNNFGQYMVERPRIQQIYNANGVRLQGIKDKIKKLYEEFFEYEGEGAEKKIKFTPEQIIPAVPEKYEERIIQKKSLFADPVTEQVKISDAIPEKRIPPTPVMWIGKTMEEFQKRWQAIVKEEIPIEY